MAKIPALPQAVTLDGSESIPLDQAGVSKRVLLRDILSTSNILLDPYNEIVARNPYVDDFDHFGGGAPLFVAPGPQSGVKTPVQIAASGVPLQRQFDGARIPFVAGSALFIDVSAWTDGTAPATLIVDWYDASGTRLTTSQFANATPGASIKSFPGTSVIPAGAVRLGLRLAGNCAKESIGWFASYAGIPKRTYPGLPHSYIAASEIGANLTPDPLLRDASAPGYGFSGAHATTDADNPYGGGSVSQSTTAALQVIVDLAQMPLKPGDMISWRGMAKFSAGDTGCLVGVSFLTAAGASIPGTDSNLQTLGAGITTGVVDMWRTATIPAGTAKIRMAAVSTQGNTRKILAFAIAEGRSRPNFERGVNGSSSSSGSSSALLPRRGATKALLYASTTFGWNGFNVDGQSLGAGANATPPITTSQPFFNIMFKGGVRAGGPELNGAGDMTAVVPLVETTDTSDGETLCSRAANAVTQRALLENGTAPANMVLFPIDGAQSSAPIANLIKKAAGNGSIANGVLSGSFTGGAIYVGMPVSGSGVAAGTIIAAINGDGTFNVLPTQSVANTALSIGTGAFDRQMAQVQAAFNLATAAGKTYGVHAIAYIQGEANVGGLNAGSPATSVPGTTDYTAIYNYNYQMLGVLRGQLDVAIKAITGQQQPVQMLMYQTALNSLASAIPSGGSITGGLQQAQLDICQNDPNFHFVTTTWFLPPATTLNQQVHLSNVGEALLGAYFGRALHQLIVEKVQPQSLRPLGAVAIGTKVRVSFEVPYAPLVLDSINLAAVANYGFAVFDDTGKRTISKVEVAPNGTAIDLTIDRALSTASFVRLAEDYGDPRGIRQYNGACGLRDSCPDVVNIAGTDYPTWHVGPHCRMPIYVTG